MSFLSYRDWNFLMIGFWSGVAVISAINISLILLNRNQFLYDEYILVIAIISAGVFTVLRSRAARRE
jgi:hypothetical protein